MSPMRPREIMRSGQNRASACTGRAVASAARSVCCTAQVFGAASAQHEDEHDVDEQADRHAGATEEPLGDERR